MKKGNYTDVKANEWVFPKMRKYKMACCDCGLVHTMDFKVILTKPTKPPQKEYFAYTTPRAPKGMTLRVSFKADRDNEETKRIRKLRHITLKDKR